MLKFNNTVELISVAYISNCSAHHLLLLALNLLLLHDQRLCEVGVFPVCCRHTMMRKMPRQGWLILTCPTHCSHARSTKVSEPLQRLRGGRAICIIQSVKQSLGVFCVLAMNYVALCGHSHIPHVALQIALNHTDVCCTQICYASFSNTKSQEMDTPKVSSHFNIIFLC